MSDILNLTFIEEEMPKVVRKGGSGREPTHWEEALAPLKDSPNKSFRVWTYEKQSSANSRSAVVRARLIDATPADDWALSVREVPAGDSKGQYGVYVIYKGVLDDAQIAARDALTKERSDRIKAAQAAKAAEAPVDVPLPDVPEVPVNQSPKDRVAAAKAAQAK